MTSCSRRDHSAGMVPRYLRSSRRMARTSSASVAHLGPERGAGDGGAAALPARAVDRQRDKHDTGRWPRGRSNISHQIGDCSTKGGSRHGRGHPLRPRADLPRVRDAVRHSGPAGPGARGLAWAVSVPSINLVYPADVELLLIQLRPARPTRQSAPRQGVGAGRDHAGADYVALGDAAFRLKGAAQGVLRSGAGARRRQPHAAPPRQGEPMSARRRRLWLLIWLRASRGWKSDLSNVPSKTSRRPLASVIEVRWAASRATST